ncbi:glycosyltransferase family 2 protein [Halioglobus maricola]|uniref:glycosyltransferase family 2 protein n=1 Tax=Halioglobus maricola TaxID=2601894 RepID=UPI0014781AF4|nr:glycosyltransferase family 2 protein [Halioglobus maricola]
MIVPKLSIGLPVYNGENFLAGAIGSLLDQSYRDFELIISDNASTDRTAEICLAFAATDDRIRYVRNDENQGAAANYNQCLALASGEYFKWAAHDDLCHPLFLARCIAVLEANPGVVLCHSQSQGIDDSGATKGRYGEERSFSSPSPSRRMWQVISTPHVCIAVFGVMRRAVLLQTIRHGDWVGADRNLLAQLSLHGKVVLVPEVLFKRREHLESSIHKFEDEQERLAWFNPAFAGKRSRPTWRRWQEYNKAVHGAPLGLVEKARCYLQLLRWVGARHHTGPRNYRMLAREIFTGAGPAS